MRKWLINLLNRADRLTLVCVWIVLAVIIPFGFFIDAQHTVDRKLRQAGETVIYKAIFEGCQRGNSSRAGTAAAITWLDKSNSSTFEQGPLDHALASLAPRDCKQQATEAMLEFRRDSK